MKQTKLGTLDARITGGTDGDGGGEGPLVVLLHGFGAPGDDLVGLWRALPAPRGTRYVFPEAPVDLGPAYAGGLAWWFIDMQERLRKQQSGQRDITEVPVGLDQARQQVIALVEEAVALLKPHAGNVVLGGFSQGAMLSLDVTLRSSIALSGLVMMSGTHIAANEWAPKLASRKGLPVFMSHGREDPLLPFSIAEELRDTLNGAGLPVEWVPFRGGHAIPPAVTMGMGAFLTRVLKH
jgi:phospholipase/carboxylesterase